jgi:hypothetical protein
MIVERYPESNVVVSGLIPNCEILSLLDRKNWLGGYAPPMFQKQNKTKQNQKQKE